MNIGGAAPSVALSGLEIYSGEESAHWKGDLIVGPQSQEAQIYAVLNNEGAVTGTENVLSEEIGRIREVRKGPDGRLCLPNDDPEGGICRIDPTS